MELTRENLQNLRQDYRSAELAETDVHKNPIVQFEKWFQNALDAKLHEPNVMTLATADSSGKPSARIVLLKGLDDNGFTFYTNYESHKGKELNENPRAALVFFWAELERQVRIEGLVSKADQRTSDEYFHSRPIGSQIGAVASPQSKTIESREILGNIVNELTEAYINKEIPRPDHWGGYILKPLHIEFWQGRPSRLHDRIAYDYVNGNWIINRLAP